MSTTVQTNPSVHLFACGPNPELLLNVSREGDNRVVHVTGELDLATRDQLFAVSTVGNHPTMTIDLAGVAFMDCSGYGALVASRTAIEAGGRTLTIRGQNGQPARLITMIADLERPNRVDHRVD